MNRKVLDIDDVMQRVQDDKELLLELLDIFEEFYPEKRDALTGLLEAGDCDQIRDIVHSIKGAAGNISAKAVHTTCMSLEMMASNGDIEGVRALMPSLDSQYVELQKCMAKAKQELKGK